MAGFEKNMAGFEGWPIETSLWQGLKKSAGIQGEPVF
jgi:hypothetical protein